MEGSKVTYIKDYKAEMSRFESLALVPRSCVTCVKLYVSLCLRFLMCKVHIITLPVPLCCSFLDNNISFLDKIVHVNYLVKLGLQ